MRSLKSTNNYAFYLEIMQYLEHDPDVRKILPALQRQECGDEETLTMILCLFINITVELIEEKHKYLPYYPDSDICYQKAVAQFRCALNNEDDEARRQYLKNAGENLELALAKEPANPKYYYAAGSIACSSNDR